MSLQIARRLASRTKLFVTMAGLVGLALPAVSAQTAPRQPLPTAKSSAPGKSAKPAFEVASVRQNKSDDQPYMNVSPVLGDSPVSTGGLYSARNIKLIQYIAFAYSLTQIQLESVVKQVPSTNEDRFDIEARAPGDPTKAEYRLMMQSLLEDRFKLAVHLETKSVPIYALVLAKRGKLGPQIRLHKPNDPVCAPPTAPIRAPIEADAEGFPLACGGPMTMKPSAAGRMKSGGRGVAMARFAAIITGVGEVDRPIVDQTGIEGTVDYTIEWGKEIRNNGPNPSVVPDPDAPTFKEARQEQMGIKMVQQMGPQELFFIDHLEKPSEN